MRIYGNILQCMAIYGHICDYILLYIYFRCLDLCFGCLDLYFGCLDLYLAVWAFILGCLDLIFE